MNLNRDFSDRIIRELGKNFAPTIEQVCEALICEAVEMNALTNWKWWRKPKPLDKEKMLEESIDALHFLLIVWEILNVSPQKVFDKYCWKNKINHERLDRRDDIHPHLGEGK